MKSEVGSEKIYQETQAEPGCWVWRIAVDGVWDAPHPAENPEGRKGVCGWGTGRRVTECSWRPEAGACSGGSMKWGYREGAVTRWACGDDP